VIVTDLAELPNGEGLSLADKVFLVLKQNILTLAIKPREYLVIREIAARYGISPTPVREAFIRLEREGWLRIDGRRGAQVILPSAQTLLEIVETEAALEAHIARRAAEIITDEQLCALAQLLAEADAALAADQFVRCREMGEEFHRWLYTIVGNDYLAHTIHGLEEQVMRIRTLLWNVDKAPVVDSARQHHEILAALQQRDPDAAYRAMYHHTVWYEKKLVTTLALM
jgi:GntR family transcriptional regulator, rspAB operon transcriptional repressor